jgi:hypothetical protein
MRRRESIETKLGIPPFWKAEPKPPNKDGRSWSLLIPAVFSVTGFFFFAVMAFGFTAVESVPGLVRMATIIGAFALAFGGEVGTLSTTVEIYRKSKGSEAVWWDWAGLLISLLTTAGEFVLAFALLLGERASWSAVVQIWGPIALGLCCALDAYALFMEYGFYLASYDRRRKAWEIEQGKYIRGELKRKNALGKA